MLFRSGITYAIRVVPFLIVRKKIKNRYVSAFLSYIPYAVLAAMTVPAIFTATSSVTAGAAGFVVAVLLAYFEKGLLQVALSASGVVLITQIIMILINTY